MQIVLYHYIYGFAIQIWIGIYSIRNDNFTCNQFVTYLVDYLTAVSAQLLTYC